MLINRILQDNRIKIGEECSTLANILIFPVQHSPFIMLCLGHIGMDHAISESCDKGTILQKNYIKENEHEIITKFSYNSFVNFHG